MERAPSDRRCPSVRSHLRSGRSRPRRRPPGTPEQRSQSANSADDGSSHDRLEQAPSSSDSRSRTATIFLNPKLRVDSLTAGTWNLLGIDPTTTTPSVTEISQQLQVGRAEFEAMLRRSVEREESVSWVIQRQRPLPPLLAEVQPCITPSQAPTGVVIALTELSAGRFPQSEEDTAGERLRSREVDHRLKNLFEVVLGLLELTRTSFPEPPNEFASILGSRVRALARAEEALRNVEGVGVGLQELARKALEPFQAKGRIQMEGPELELSPNAVWSVGVALNELATNAVRYGALSDTRGRVRLEWRPERNGEIRIEWTEFDGPRVTAPDRTGFGRLLIEEGLRQETGGEARMHFLPEGIRCELVIPRREDAT